jgi:hypothetical protein
MPFKNLGFLKLATYAESTFMADLRSCCINFDATSTPAALAGVASLQSSIGIALQEVEIDRKEKLSLRS